ncbi:MAG: hypothetical protein ABSG96_27775 [Terracidiphilus sp.]
MNSRAEGENATPVPNDHPLPVAEIKPSPLPVEPADPPAPPAIQNRVAADPVQGKRGEEELHSVPPPLGKDVNNELSLFERKTVFFGYWGIVFGFVSLVLAAGAAFFVFQQFKEMAAQTELLNRGARQARVDSANSSVVTAEQLAILEKQLNQQTGATRLDERAWIVVSPLLPDIAKVSVPTGEMVIVNTGKTPALHIHGMAQIEVLSHDSGPRLQEKTYDWGFDSGELVPHDPAPQTLVRLKDRTTKEQAPFTNDERTAYNSGKSWIAIYGTIWYDDIFHVRHFTRFCRPFSNPNIAGEFNAMKCVNYNGTDGKKAN